MTEYELIDAAASFQSIGTTHFMNFVSVMFAYLVCAYLVGDKLTLMQLWIVNSLYAIFSIAAGGRWQHRQRTKQLHDSNKVQFSLA